MRKRNELDEFIKQLEDAVDEMIEEIECKAPVNIEISINLCPFMASTDSGRTPVDMLETEKNVHAILKIPDMEMETIKLASSGKVLEITALSGGEAVNEKVELPAKVNKTGMKTTYKNGILELVFIKRKVRSN